MIKEAVCVTFYFLLFQPQRPALATSKAIQQSAQCSGPSHTKHNTHQHPEDQAGKTGSSGTNRTECTGEEINQRKNYEEM